MNTADFELLAELLKKESGLIVTPDKAYLLESRLMPVARKREFADIAALVLKLRAMPERSLVNDIVEAMTTNETSFFRDIRPFERFENTVLPFLLEARKTKKLRIWCAAASSGQEPYTLAMLMNEKGLYDQGWNIEIIGTDIDNSVLDRAREGIYTQFEVQRGLPVKLLMKYFSQKDDKWQINEDIRSKVKYSQLNLLKPFSVVGSFDIIFCRNVLIYFDQETKGDILDRMANNCAKDGFLFLGGAETVMGITKSFVAMPQERGLYVLNDSEHLSSAA